MLIKEFRIPLPISVEEYQVAQLWSVAEMSKDETGGGEGIEVKKNEPYVDDEEHGTGQYTLKVYHIASRVPKFVKLLAPKGSLEFTENAWNSYPYCKTVVTNPSYMQGNFSLSIETWHKPDLGYLDNVHNLDEKELKQREIINIDIAKDPVSAGDYKPEFDPCIIDSGLSGRGPLQPEWLEDLRSSVKADSSIPHMCAYKLVKCHFKWWGLQKKVERMIQNQERRLFNNFHRQVFCCMNKWHDLSMDDIRRIEDNTQKDLEELRKSGSVKGMKIESED